MLRRSLVHDNSQSAALNVTPEWLERHDREGPRYTSYPTAVELHEGFSADDYATRLAAANTRSSTPLSLYLHLPFCEERCLFCGCHVLISPHRERALPYLDDLHREFNIVAEHLPDRRTFAQLHLGGGTPTFFSPRELESALLPLFEQFTPVPGAELAIEVDPVVTSQEHLAALAGLGFNRLSVGVQDFTPKVQEAIGRIQSREETAAILDGARSRGFSGLNVDLIYGLPYQTPETFAETIDAVIDLGADRAAVYSFAFVPWLRGHQKKLPREAFPDREAKFQLFSVARERFLAAGYVPIGMDHFARPDDELAKARRAGTLRRNFQGYTVIPADDVIGFGISSIGDVDGALVQNEKKWSTFHDHLVAGRLPIERGFMRSADDQVRRAVIADLMCNFRVDVRKIERDHGIDFASTFTEDLARLQPYVREGLAEVGPDPTHPQTIRATPLGELVVRNIAQCFDLYWREKHEGDDRPRFSRTI